MGGTLSLFDWRPAGLEPAVPAGAASASDSAPVALSVAPGAAPASGRKRRSGARALAAVPASDAAVSPGPGADPVPGPVLEALPILVAPPALVAIPGPVAPAEPAALPPPVALAEGSGPVAVGPPEAHVLVFEWGTSGTDRVQDQVIELCIQRGLSDGAPSRTWRIKPTAPIHPGAQAVHGITMAELEGCPSFAEVAGEIAAVFAEAEVIVGYNIAFDIDMLQAEYTRIGKPLLDLNGKKIVDAFRLWQQCEPRSLQHAHQRFVGNGFASAHSANADVAATGRVLAGMLRAFDLAGQDWDAIASKSDPQHAARASWVGPSRHLRWEGEIIVLGFGKHANTALHELAAGPDRSFLRWVIERDFPVHVSEVCRAALDLARDEFLAWARRRYPPPAPPAPLA